MRIHLALPAPSTGLQFEHIDLAIAPLQSGPVLPAMADVRIAGDAVPTRHSRRYHRRVVGVRRSEGQGGFGRPDLLWILGSA